jgi:glutamine synthetase
LKLGPLHFDLVSAWKLQSMQGVGNRGVSIRVGGDTEKEGKGYLEDRRPSSNMDPYVVCGMLAYTTLVWKPGQALC